MARYLLATIFLLCLLTNSCSARHYRRNAEVSTNHSYKGIEKLWGKVMSVDDQGGGGVVDHDQRPRRMLRRSRRRTSKAIKHKGHSEMTVINSAVEKKSVISWHVPPKHHNDDNLPGIYSDYPKPRSRPPSHN